MLAAYFLFHDADLASLRAALETVAFFDLSAAQREVPAHDARAIPSTYLLPTRDRTLRPDWMARAALERLGVQPIELDGGHNCYAGQPDLVADAIEAV